MSDRLVTGDTSVEAVITDLLQEQGIRRRGDARLAAEELTAPTEVILGTPPVADLPDHFETSVSEGLDRLATQYETFPREWSITALEIEILGIIGLGLEGDLSGPRTVSLPTSHTTVRDRGSVTDPVLAETELPTDSVSRLSIDGTQLSPEALAYYDAILNAADQTIPEPTAKELAQDLRNWLEDVDADWSDRSELRKLVDDHLKSILRSKGLADVQRPTLVDSITEQAEAFYDEAST